MDLSPTEGFNTWVGGLQSALENTAKRGGAMPLETEHNWIESIDKADTDTVTAEFRDRLYESLTNIGAVNGWISACRTAVAADREDWLVRYTSEADITQLSLFLRRFHREEPNLPGNSRPLTTRV